ncbi:shikimate dehydrogenase [Paenibacillus alginolyticus]|uniref:Shikimate dehydrogenase (NADP(+)) n=1 Tax=Paenibacillus alginolyticus TaxID=59839 RepID=A0ABT4GHY8_9BACL|nr:shikimate dehydrogenase [Paenibacillus alginolyticus]MCY9669412.1 shikimate dehydrogenase [Paenibacillus alginolyticus]MCY9695824.1 shikimate dehydrogenase [Paenibacillus alginolyticus]MEC0143868.1 shikimate dehydrogenase [Paenibacillus alginolyticus]
MEKLVTTIDSHTILYGVFGDPIRHSRSPIMLNRAFQEAGINAVYAAFHVRPEELGDAVRGIRALGYRGINVTIPHKVEVMQYLDEIDEGARIVGAVNTIVNESGKLIGYNTDGIGYVRSLKEETGIELKGKSVLLLGAGGAARGVAYALAKEGARRIYIANRTKERALELADTISSYTEAIGLGMDELGHVVDEVQFVLNTTSAGMHPHVDEVPLPLEFLRSHHLVSDLIYNPRITRFLHEAEARGARIHGGLGMFIYQGAFAFEYWTGAPAPVAAMRQVVEQSLAE